MIRWRYDFAIGLFVASLVGCGLDSVGPDLEAWRAAQDVPAGDTSEDIGNGDASGDGGGDLDAPDGAGDCGADGTPCDDGDPCTVDDRCASGVCVAGPAKACDDGNACTTDSCGVGGECTHQAVDPATCDDGDPCTTDLCTPGKGCTAEIAGTDGVACDDGSPCTADDACASGQCVGTPLLGPIELDAGHASVVRAARRVGSVTLAVGARAETPIKPLESWIVAQTAQGAATVTLTSAIGAPAIPSKLVLDDVVAAGADGKSALFAGVSPSQQGEQYVVVHAALDGKASAVATHAPGGSVQAPRLALLPGGGGVVVGRHASPDNGAETDLLLLSANYASLQPVPHALPSSDLRAVAPHPRGALVAGSEQGASARPLVVRLDASLAMIGSQPVERAGTGVVDAIEPRAAGYLAAGSWSATGAPRPTWWRLNRHGRALARGGLDVAGSVLDIAPAAGAAQRAAALLVQPQGGPARVLVLDEGTRVVADAMPLSTAATVTALAPTDDGLWIFGHVDSTQIGLPLATLTRTDGYGHADCVGAGACFGKVLGACDDDNACTDDRCLPAVGCVHPPHTDTCADGAACLTGAACSGGSCVGGSPRLWSDTSPIDKASPSQPPVAEATADGGAIVVLRGTSKAGTGAADVVRFGPDGKATWSFESMDTIVDVQPFAGGFLLASAKSDNGKVVTLLQARDDTSKVVGTETITQGDASVVAVYALTRGAANDAVGVGVAGPLAGRMQGLFVRVDASGKPLAQTVSKAKAERDRTLLEVAPYGHDGGAIAAGIEILSLEPAELALIRFTPEGAVVWARRHGIMSAAPIPGDIQLLPWEYGNTVARLARGDGYASLAHYGPMLADHYEGVFGSPQASYSKAVFALPDGGLGAIGWDSGKLAYLTFAVSGGVTNVVEEPIADAVDLAVDATVLTSGDVFVVAQIQKKDGSHAGLFRRVTPEGHMSCNDAGLCGTTPVADCLTGKACASALCTPTGGCGAAIPSTSGCFGPGCAGLGTCDAALACTPPAPDPKVCDDDDPCTVDLCTATAGCTFTLAPDGTVCDDGSPCTTSDVCTLGTCKGTDKGSCD